MLFRTACSLLLAAVASTAAAQTPAAPPPASPPNLTGAWALNPALTQQPSEIGFSPDWARGGAGGERGGGSGSGGGRGRRGGSGSSAATPTFARESADDSTRVQQLTGEARTPPAHITIIQKADAVSIADDQGHSRTFRTDGHLEELTLGTVALPTTSRWDAGSLVIVYEVEQSRQLRYTFTPSANPTRLIVSIRFLDHGHEGDEVRLTYEPPDAHTREVLSSPSATVPASPASPSGSAALPPLPYGDPTAARPPVLPAGSELRGLTIVGTVVDELGTQATACGLDQAKIKASIARILADAGFKTKPYHDEQTYVVINVSTSKLSDGLCVSRYDASLVSEADVTVPNAKGPVSLPVPLLHEGGMAGGSAAAHAASVMDGLAKSVNTFISQIRAANK